MSDCNLCCRSAFQQVLQQLFDADTESEVLAGLNQAPGLGSACAQGAPQTSSPIAGDGFSLGGGSNHGFTAYCLKGSEQTALFGGGGGGGAGFVAATGQLTNASGQGGFSASVGSNEKASIGSEADE